MPRGGAKPGERRGGRQKGTLNKRTQTRIEMLNERLEGEDPLLFWADVLKDKDMPFDARHQAAKELAPYKHAKLSSVQAQLTVQTQDDFAKVLETSRATLNGHVAGSSN